MEKRFESHITEKQYMIIDKVCEGKNVDTNQFCDFLINYGEGYLGDIVDKFINYCQTDGWFNYTRK